MSVVSIGHITSFDPPQNGHVTPCGISFNLACGPETLNVFWHFVQVTIFSIFNSLPFPAQANAVLYRLAVHVPPEDEPTHFALFRTADGQNYTLPPPFKRAFQWHGAETL